MIEAPAKKLDVIYRDHWLVAINKPSGLLVHRSMIDRYETRFAIQLLRDQIGQPVFPLHRLDKPTSGVLVFALSSEVARLAGEQFQEGRIGKTYHAIVRGYTPDSGVIDHPLKEKLDKIADRKARQDKPAREAVTEYHRLATVELPIAIDRYPSSRYSLVEARPGTGRKHQVRRHMKHISHPIIGDAKHGKGNHNRYFAENFDAGRLLLHCSKMAMCHPVTGKPITFYASWDIVFVQLLERFGWTI